MPSVSSLALFAGAALALLVIPGPSVLYVITTSATHGRRAGLASVAGIHTGTLVHVGAAAVGLSALVVSSTVAFSVVKYAGAAYLITIGLTKIVHRGRATALTKTEGARSRSLRRLYGQGAVVNITNPKTAIFFLAFLPQFIDTTRGSPAVQIAVFGAVFVTIGVLSDGAYALAAGTLAGRLRRSQKVARRTEAVSGGIYIALGVTASRV